MLMGPVKAAHVPTVLSASQILAAEKWERDFQNAQRLDNAGKRMTASDNRRAAQRAMSPTDVAILDAISGRGTSIATLAQKTGRSPGELASMYSGATGRLAAFYESQRSQDHG